MTKKTTKKSSKKAKRTESKENEKAVAALSYILIGIIWFFAEEEMSKSKFAKLHVKQAINLWVVMVGIQVVAGAMFLLGALIAFLGSLLGLVLIILGIINVVKGKKKKLPVIGGLAEKYLDF